MHATGGEHTPSGQVTARLLNHPPPGNQTVEELIEAAQARWCAPDAGPYGSRGEQRVGRCRLRRRAAVEASL
jgi:hypothetical protein